MKRILLERTRTRYVLREGLPPLLFALVRMLFRKPIRFAAALALAWRMSRRADRPLVVHLAYLAEACRIVPWLWSDRVQHLHAHFGSNPAEIAMIVHVLGGPQWSFTAHGIETFDHPKQIGLPEKISRCAFVAAVSSYGRAQLYRWISYPMWQKVHIVHCGLEEEYHHEDWTDFHTSRLVCVGRLSAEKGQLFLLEALRMLSVEGIAFELVFVGDGELRPKLEELIRKHRLEKRVRITGWIGPDDVQKEILAARALVLPSFTEGLPVVLMEAMALCRPVIATYVAGIPELVEFGRNGWLVPAGDAPALAAALRDCLDSQSMQSSAWEKLGAYE